MYGLQYNASTKYMTVLSKPPFFSGLCCFDEDSVSSVGGSWIRDGLMILNSQKERNELPQPTKGKIPDGIEQMLPKRYESEFKEDHTDMYKDL